MRKCRLYFLLLLTLHVLAIAGRAQEQVRAFHSDLTLAADGSLLVQETITVSCAQQEIRHGISREIVTQYRNRLGHWVSLDVLLLQAQRDGSVEEVRTAKVAHGVRFYLGHPGSLLPLGPHTYHLTYRVIGAVDSAGARQEIYWNATGYSWDFPIDQASVTLALPAMIAPNTVHCSTYTGPRGSDTGMANAQVDATGECRYATCGPLDPGSGFIIMADFPRALHGVAPAATQDPAQKYGLFGLLLISAYYLCVWLLVRRAPMPATHIPPCYSSPDGMSPAALRYVWKMGYDTKVLAVALVDLAIHGVITIVNHGKDFRLESEQSFHWNPERCLLQELASGIPVDERILAKRLAEPVADIRKMITALIRKGVSLEVDGRVVRLRLNEPTTMPVPAGKLSPDAWRLACDLLGPAQGLRLDEHAYDVVQEAIKHQRQYLHAKYARRYFNSHNWYLLPGVLLSVAVAVLVMYYDFSYIIPTTAVQPAHESNLAAPALAPVLQLFLRPLLTAIISAGVAFIIEALVCKRGARHFIVLGAVVTAPVALLIFLQIKYAIFNHFPIAFLLIVFLLWVVNLLFYHLLKTPTAFGQRILAHLQGFRTYFQHPAHAWRAHPAQAPKESAETFERYLPYAMALDAERPWIEHYGQIFNDSQANASPYFMHWLTGDRPGHFDAEHLINAINDDLANAISRSAISDHEAQDSSTSHHGSSSGGGGGSGHGGGGGGGGW